MGDKLPKPDQNRFRLDAPNFDAPRFTIHDSRFTIHDSRFTISKHFDFVGNAEQSVSDEGLRSLPTRRESDNGDP